MKRCWIILIMCIAVLPALPGCSAAKKTKQTSGYDHAERVSRDAESTSTLRYVDTTHAESQRVTITEVGFYPPPAVGLSDGDTITAIIALDGIGRIENAPIRSVRQTVIETVVEEKGESLETEEREEEVVRSEAVIHSKEVSKETSHPP